MVEASAISQNQGNLLEARKEGQCCGRSGVKVWKAQRPESRAKSTSCGNSYQSRESNRGLGHCIVAIRPTNSQRRPINSEAEGTNFVEKPIQGILADVRVQRTALRCSVGSLLPRERWPFNGWESEA